MTFSQFLNRAILAASLSVASLSAAQFTYSLIYRSPAPDNAAQPPLTAAKTGGALYATTESGGAFGHGSVISLTAPATGGSWLQTTLYSFTGGADGVSPNAGLALAPNGTLYGSTLGTLFQLTPPAAPGAAWTEKAIYSIRSPNSATGNLAIDPAGNLYGTVEGNPQLPNPLAIYRFTAPTTPGGAWTGNSIYNFASSNDVQGGLMVTPKGVVISTIANNVIGLKVSADGTTATASPIYNLAAVGLSTSATAVITPSGAIVLPVIGGSQYGQIVALEPPTVAGGLWTESVLFAFNGADGYDAEGTLALSKNGNIYGTTYGGGTNQYGTVFQLTPPAASGNSWTEKVLHNFLGNQSGQEPTSGLIASGSALFGLAGISGDNLNDLGFELAVTQ